MGKPVDDGATKSVDDLLASVFPTPDESEVVDLANPAADDIDVGVPSDKTQKAMESHLEPPPPQVTSHALKEQICRSNDSLKSAGNAAGAIRKEQVRQLLLKLDAASPAELADLQGQGSWMKDLIPNKEKSSGAGHCGGNCASRVYMAIP